MSQAILAPADRQDSHSEYGINQVTHQQREFGFLDTVVTWFGSGVNTGSWFFGGMAAALGLGFVYRYSFIYLPLLMIPWAMVGWIAWRHGSSTVISSIPALGVKGSRLAGIGEFFGMIGWPSVNTFIAAISLTYVFKQMFGWAAYQEAGDFWPLVFGILITALAQGIIVVIGHRAIKYLEWVAVILLIVLGLWEMYVVFTHWDYHLISTMALPESMNPPQFYMDLAIGFCWGWAMIGDFARMGRTSTAATFGSWIGVNLGQGWFMLIGAVGVLGVVLDTGIYDPNNSDPSSIIASLGLGTVAFLVVFFATVSTNVTVLYGSGIGLVGATRSASPKKYLWFIAILQLVMCFLPLAYSQFVAYFEMFLGLIGGIFVPLWTLIVADYYIVRRMRVRDEDLFAEFSGGRTESRMGDWNAAGWIAGLAGLGLFYLLHYFLTDIARVTTAAFPAIALTAVLYIVLTLGFGMGRETRRAAAGTA